MRVLVIGASGYYGTQVVRSLQQVDGIDVLRGRRKGGDGWIQIDLADISTYSAFEQADLILNCADTVGAPSDQAVLFCLKHGHTFFEMGADTPTLQRLLRLPIPADSTGRAVIGVGIFPGLSTVLAHHASQQVEDCQRLDFAVRISPFSGAGKANCALMAKMLAEPAIRYRQRPPPKGAGLLW